MQKTLVWEVVQSFSKAELRAFRQFLDAPFFNKREDMRILFQYLVDCQKGLNKKPTREEAFQKMCLGVPFNDQQFRLRASYLLKLVEQYLIWQEGQDRFFQNQTLLLAAYRKRQLNNHFEQTLRKTRKQLATQSYRHPDYYFTNFQLEQEYYHTQLATGRTKALNLQVVEDQLDAAFLSMKLRQACFSRAHQAVFNAEYRIALLDEILILARLPRYQQIPAVCVYFHCYRALFQSEEEGYFEQFKQQLFEHTNHFPKAEIRDLYLLALNFCIRKINENKRQYFQEALDLYKNGLEQKLLIENGRISRFTYNNIVGIALRIEDFTWVEWFVQQYKDYLEPSYQDMTFSLNSARLEYARKNYAAALLFLQKADYNDLINNMVAKTLQLKIYYELHELDLLESHLKTMETFIRRNKKMGYHHQNWTNIVRYTKKLMTLNPFDKAARKSVQKAIEAEEILTEKEWLLKVSLIS